MSTARLDTRNPNYPNEQNAAQTAHRLYKLVLKSVARLAGLKSPDACILAFPRTLEELDLKSAEFCPDDRAKLVKAGILKPVEDVGTGCGLVASREWRGWSANLAASADAGLRERFGELQTGN
jgi:hypothetical protein